MLKQGEIWLANLNPGKGSEPAKTRPVLIMQGQALIDAGHPSTLIIPLTTKLIENAEPLRIRVAAHGRLKHDSDLLIDQLRAIDNRRLTVGARESAVVPQLEFVEQCRAEERLHAEDAILRNRGEI